MNEIPKAKDNKIVIRLDPKMASEKQDEHLSTGNKDDTSILNRRSLQLDDVIDDLNKYISTEGEETDEETKENDNSTVDNDGKDDLNVGNEEIEDEVKKSNVSIDLDEKELENLDLEDVALKDNELVGLDKKQSSNEDVVVMDKDDKLPSDNDNGVVLSNEEISFSHENVVKETPIAGDHIIDKAVKDEGIETPLNSDKNDDKKSFAVDSGTKGDDIEKELNAKSIIGNEELTKEDSLVNSEEKQTSVEANDSCTEEKVAEIPIKSAQDIYFAEEPLIEEPCEKEDTREIEPLTNEVVGKSEADKENVVTFDKNPSLVLQHKPEVGENEEDIKSDGLTTDKAVANTPVSDEKLYDENADEVVAENSKSEEKLDDVNANEVVADVTENPISEEKLNDSSTHEVIADVTENPLSEEKPLKKDVDASDEALTKKIDSVKDAQNNKDEVLKEVLNTKETETKELNNDVLTDSGEPLEEKKLDNAKEENHLIQKDKQETSTDSEKEQNESYIDSSDKDNLDEKKHEDHNSSVEELEEKCYKTHDECKSADSTDAEEEDTNTKSVNKKQSAEKVASQQEESLKIDELNVVASDEEKALADSMEEELEMSGLEIEEDDFVDSMSCCATNNGEHTCDHKKEVDEKNETEESDDLDDDIDALLANLDDLDLDNDDLANDLLDEFEPKTKDIHVVKKYKFKICTSLASMDRHMVSRTNKLITILLAQEDISEDLLELCDIGTDENYKKIWYRKALNSHTRQPLSLPGIFRENGNDDIFIGNYEMIYDYNENFTVEEHLWPELKNKPKDKEEDESNSILMRLLGKKL
ncbi:hypothetical protein FOG51_03618 [Hanseniaspora uvarum]|nr:hypothetical protein FOG51_03618 [Hanseniaspora uvarum]